MKIHIKVIIFFLVKIVGAFPVNRFISQVPNILFLSLCQMFLKRKKNIDVYKVYENDTFTIIFLKREKD